LSDEVYEHIYFDEATTVSVLRHNELMQRTLAVYSFGKTFHATGWKVGYVIAPASLTKEFRKVHQFNVFSTNTPIQYALAAYMSEPSTYENLPAFYQQKRDYFLELIKDLPFTFTPSKGSYFQIVDYSAVSNLNDLEFAKKLTIEAGVATVPVSAFYKDGSNDKFIRFCFAKKEETLAAAAERLAKYFNV
jgi:methionine aminotransferase